MRKDLDLSFELICTMRAFGCPVSEMFRTEFVAVASHVWSCFSHWASILCAQTPALVRIPCHSGACGEDRSVEQDFRSQFISVGFPSSVGRVSSAVKSVRVLYNFAYWVFPYIYIWFRAYGVLQGLGVFRVLQP